MATVFVVGTPWVKVGRSILLPPLWLNKDYVLAAVAVVATTVSPYLFLAGGADGITAGDRNVTLRRQWRAPRRPRHKAL